MLNIKTGCSSYDENLEPNSVHIGNMHVESLVKLLALRDAETEEHTRRVTNQALELAQVLMVPEREYIQIWRGAMLHDIGKIGIPDNVLHKCGCLSRAEQDVIQMHPVYAYKFLSSIPYLRSAMDIPYCHHERWNGTGYPRGLAGKEIPFFARLFAVVDVWDALLSDRPYHSAWSFEETKAYIWDQSGTLFDPDIVNAFERLVSSSIGVPL